MTHKDVTKGVTPISSRWSGRNRSRSTRWNCRYSRGDTADFWSSPPASRPRVSFFYLSVFRFLLVLFSNLLVSLVVRSLSFADCMDVILCFFSFNNNVMPCFFLLFTSLRRSYLLAIPVHTNGFQPHTPFWDNFSRLLSSGPPPVPLDPLCRSLLFKWSFSRNRIIVLHCMHCCRSLLASCL